jgi:RecJ-like exonuclease
MSKWEICCNCEGEGAHSKRLGVINVDDWDSESLDDYMAGGYDQPCEVCKGIGKVLAGKNRVEKYYATDEEYYWKREGGY